MSLVEMTRGDSPVILSFPHTGTEVPRRIWERSMKMAASWQTLTGTFIGSIYLKAGCRFQHWNEHGVTCDPAIRGQSLP